MSVVDLEQGDDNLLLLIQAHVDESGDNSDLGKLLSKVRRALGASDEVEEKDMILRDTLLYQDLDGHERRATGSQHRIEQQNPSVGNILWKLLIVKLGLRRLLVSLNKDLSNPHRPTALPQTLLHGLSSTHNGNTADLALELDALVALSNRGGDSALHDGQMVKTFLNE